MQLGTDKAQSTPPRGGAGRAARRHGLLPALASLPLLLVLTTSGASPDDGEPMTRALLSYADASYLDALRATASPHGWGLTYAWDAYQDGSTNPQSTAYAITTALVLQAFLDADAIGPAERAIAERWNACCFTDGFWWYSDQPADAIYTPNVVAMLAGVMYRLGYTDEADAAIRLLVASTDRPGWPTWRYSAVSSQPNDMLHHLYTVWGIETYRAAGGSVEIPWSAADALAATPPDSGLWPAAGHAYRYAFGARFLASAYAADLGVAPANRRDLAHVVFAAAQGWRLTRAATP